MGYDRPSRSNLKSGKTKISELVRDGTWESAKVGKRRLIRFRSIRNLDRQTA